jgi:AcrR family transcriptional regulator
MVESVSAPRTGGNRRERFRTMMRADILTAALGIVRESGIKGLTMRALAQAVGVTAPTLYEYFPGKEQVLDALFMEGTERLRALFHDAIESIPPGAAQLRAVGHAYRRFAHEDTEQFMLIFGRKDLNYIPGEEVRGSAQELFEILVQVVARGMEAGELIRRDPIESSIACWAAIHGLVQLEINGFLDKCISGDPNEALESVLSILLVGVHEPGSPIA